MFTRNASLELAGNGARVNVISPWLVATSATAGIIETPDVIEAFVERIPVCRAGNPDEIAAGAAFLTSDGASCIMAGWC